MPIRHCDPSSTFATDWRSRSAGRFRDRKSHTDTTTNQTQLSSMQTPVFSTSLSSDSVATLVGNPTVSTLSAGAPSTRPRESSPTASTDRSDRNLADDPAAKLMVIDDEPVNIKVVCRLLRLEGYDRFVSTSDSSSAMELIRVEKPDLVLLDLMMPKVSGLDILGAMRRDPATSHIPVIVLTASTQQETRNEALHRGANDFLTKPIDSGELSPRIGNLLKLKRYQDELRDQSRRLEAAVAARTIELEASRRDILHCLARAAEFRDDDTGHHILRVGRYTRLIAEQLGCDDEYLDCIEQAAQLHDVGKLGIADEVLKKPGRLTGEEFARMQRHAGLGKQVLQRMSPKEEQILRDHADIGGKVLATSHSPVLAMATKIALTHHEWWNGDGYPLGLKGEDIPIEGRMTAVADVFDALSTRRCYKKAIPIDECFDIMNAESGTHFEPRLLDAFLERRSDIVAIQMHYADAN